MKSGIYKNRISKRMVAFLVVIISATTLIPDMQLGCMGGIATAEAAPRTDPVPGTPYDTAGYTVSEPHVIINQVYGAGKDGYASHSFIELYNPTNITVDMGGWSLQYKSSEDGKVTDWQKLELTSSINAHSSYLIRCKGVEEDSNVKYTISSCDQDWDQSIHNKGFSIMLVASDNDIAGEVFDNSDASGGVPTIGYYVDMLSAAGNDYDEADSKKKKQKPYHFEGEFSAIQSKKKAIRRKGFKDTDNNAADTEAVDYSNESSYYDRRPRSSADREWKCTEIKFSHQSGFYDDPFDFEMSTLADGDIYYTLDGSTPDPENGNAIKYNEKLHIEDATGNPNVYSMRTDTSPGYDIINSETGQTRTGYIVPDYNVDKCTIIRAAVYSDSGDRISEEYSKSFFVGMKNRDSIKNLYVVSLTCEPEDLFGYDRGIYVLGKTNGGKGTKIPDWWNTEANYRNKGKEWERVGSVDFYDDSSCLILSQKVGVRVHGAATRAEAQKSLNLYSREEYDGNNRFKYDFFNTGNNPKKIQIFAGGNDIVSKSSDLFINTLCIGDNNMDVMNMLPCAVFLNGEYWGMYYITEKYDEKYIEDKYGIDDENVVMVKNGSREDDNSDDMSLWNTMRSFIANNDMEDDENYKKACELIDIDSFIIYYATEIYVGNSDWPGHNYAAWRSKNVGNERYKDGKWRWMLFDVDYSFVLSKPNFDHITRTIQLDPVFKSLMFNKEFRRKFGEVLSEVGSMNFNESRYEEIIKEYKEQLENSIIISNRRFYGNSFSTSRIDQVINTEQWFLKERYAFINNVMQDYVSNPAKYLKDTVIHFRSVSASCISAGMREYWQNSRTKRLYADEDCKKEISEDSLVIPATGHHYIDTVVAATKSEEGYTRHICEYCGATYTDSFTKYSEENNNPTGNESPSKNESPNADKTISDIITATINLPMNYSSEKRDNYLVSYFHTIPFWGKSKLNLSNIGDISVCIDNKTYIVTKVKVNRKKLLFQVLGLEGANKETIQKIKKATSGKRGLPIEMVPYQLTDQDTVIIKKKKNGIPKSIKIYINEKYYKAKKDEWTYDMSKKTISFTSNRVNGILQYE